jgi:hypothetical protein
MRSSLIMMLCLVVFGCSNGNGGTDAGTDGGDDAGHDAGQDAGDDPGGGDDGGVVDSGDSGGGDLGPCTVVPQAGCPAGFACVPNDVSDQTGVCRTAGTKDTWEVCAPGSGECLPGNLCMDMGGEGRCLKLCSADDQCQRQYECYKGDRLIDIEWTDLGFCLITMDDQCGLPDTDCLAGEKCAPFGGHEALICVDAGDQTLGQDCGAQGADDCESGAICIDRGGPSQCEQLCSADYACQDVNTVCLDYFENENVGVCLGGECSLPDVGCAAGEGCYIAGGAAYVCLPEGTAGAGDDCETADCAAGLICVHLITGTTCQPLCDEDNPCTETGYYCKYPWDDLPFSGYCKEMCNPVTQDGCQANEGCYTDYDGETFCFDAGSLQVGDDCSSMTALCIPGAECIETATAGVYECMLFCDDLHPCAQGACTPTIYRGVKVCQ